MGDPILSLTPNERCETYPLDADDWLAYGCIHAYGWNTGLYCWLEEYEPTARGDAVWGGPTLLTNRWIIEGLGEQAHRNRLLLWNTFNHEDNTQLGNYWEHCVVSFHVQFTSAGLAAFAGKLVLAIFDFETIRPNDVQIFVGDSLVKTVPVHGRKSAGVVTDSLEQWFEMYARPTRLSELYIHGIEVYLVG